MKVIRLNGSAPGPALVPDTVPQSEPGQGAKTASRHSSRVVLLDKSQVRGNHDSKRANESSGTRNRVLTQEAVSGISSALRQLLADIFTLYLKTKNFHWRLNGRRFRDYHLLLDEHSGQILLMTDEIAERARKIGGPTLRSVGDIARLQRLKDNDADHVTPREMLMELRDDNLQLTKFLRSTRITCGKYGDVATTSLIETWICQTEYRSWFLAAIADGI